MKTFFVLYHMQNVIKNRIDSSKRKQTNCLLILMLWIFLVTIGKAPAQIKETESTQNQADEIKVSLVKLKLSKDGEKVNVVEEEAVIKELFVSTKEFEKVETEDFGQIEIKIEQFKVAHEKGDIVRLKLETKSNRRLFAEAVAVSVNGEIINLLEANRGYELPVTTLAIQTDEEIIRYVIAVHNRAFTRITFSEGLSVSRAAEQIAGAAMMTNLGAIYEARGDYEKFIEFYEGYTLLAKGKREVTGEVQEAAAYNNLGLLNFKISRYDKSLEYYQKALELLKLFPADSNERIEGEASTFNNIGQVYNALARFELAVEYFNKSFIIKQKINDRQGQFIVLNNLGAAHNLPGKYNQAIQYYNQALALARLLKDDKGEAVTLNNLASAKRALGNFTEAQTLLDQSLKLSLQTKNLNNQAFALNNLGLLNMGFGKFAAAIDFYQKALQLYRALGNPAAESVALSNLMFALEKLNQPVLAIFYGKHSVNITQKLRSEFARLDKETQKSFLNSRSDTYRKLANLLVAEGRFPEAQAVLDLLKEEEYRQLTRTGEKTETVPYSSAETEVIGKIENLVALERERSTLEKILKETGTLSAEQEAKLEKLRLNINAANRAFDDALAALGKAETKDVSVRVEEIKGGQELQGALSTLAQKTKSGVVALYTVLGTDEEKDTAGKTKIVKSRFGWVIMVREGSYTAYPIDVKNLEENVFAFRNALTSDRYDPQPLAGRIYDAIFRQPSKQKRTLEQDLRDYFVPFSDKTIMWSLDGVLRYIPMAALHDGRQYLVENYRTTVFTNTSKTLLAVENETDWRVLGLGVSDKKENFDALPGVKTELETIVREPQRQTGILNGAIRLNDNFRKQTFFNTVQAGAFPVVHIASHYKFDTGKQDNSFLLIGDGRLTFAEMKENKNLFGKIDLLTLSACDTGVAGNGKEAEGFAYLAQDLGAKAVIASLWKVSDAGTPELMIRFYKLRAENPNMPKGEAFRLAQLSLLGAEAKDLKASAVKRSETVDLSGKRLELPLFVKDSKKPFAHPHYWASFVLIGNWR